jgi:hypothetical protein
MTDKDMLDALKFMRNERDDTALQRVIIALQSRLAQPQQEPNATRPCRSCDGVGERFTGIDEAPTSICKPCKGTGQIAFGIKEKNT